MRVILISSPQIVNLFLSQPPIGVGYTHGSRKCVAFNQFQALSRLDNLAHEAPLIFSGVSITLQGAELAFFARGTN